MGPCSRLSFHALEARKDLLTRSQIASASNQPFHNLTTPQGRDFSLKTPTNRPAEPPERSARSHGGIAT